MNRRFLTLSILIAGAFLFAAVAVAQPIGFNWSEQVNLARDSGSVLLDTNSTAKVIWDKDKSGLGGWNPADPIPCGDEVVLDFTDAEMSAPFGGGPFLGQFVGSWSADDNDGWTQDGEMLYLLAYVPAAVSSSGLDEYGVSSIVVISGWPNNAPVSHDIVGGGPIVTAPAVFVDVAAPGPGTGSPGDPFPTIQAGLTAAPSGAIVLVAHGTYTGAGNTMLDFGGKAIWLKSKSGPQAAIIDGGGGSRLFSFTSGEGPGSIVDGFTIRNGNAGLGDGGGIYAMGSNPTIMNCVIEGCTAANGGGIYYGGGGGGGAIINCLIINNAATDKGGGVCADGSDLKIGAGCTIAVNIAVTGGGACISDSSSIEQDTVTLENTATNGHEIALTNSATFTVTYCDVMGGDLEAYVEPGSTLVYDGTNIDQDPLFVTGLLHDYYLSHIAAGQGADSPCIDAGSDTAANLGLADRTTRTDGVDDAGQVDMGYHAAYPLDITDVYWDQANTQVVLEFTSDTAGTYDVESVDANDYSDALVFSPLTSIGAPSVGTTVITDNLTVNPLVARFRFYRVKRTDCAEYSWQTAAVFEMTLQAIPPVKFVSCPLVPDADHNSIRQVFGEKIGVVDTRQVPRSGFQVSDLNEATGGVSRMRYVSVGADMTFSVLAGAEFDLEPGVGYEIVMGLGANLPYTVRFTGYVANAPVLADVTKTGAQSLRWLGYSLPRDITLGQLGLETYVVPWNALNRVRLLFPGTTAWVNYKYNTVGLYWYKESVPGVPDDPTIQAGLMGVVFVRGGPAAANTLPEAPWYLRPPNEW